MAAEVGTGEGETLDGRRSKDLKPGFRAYLIKEGDKYLITLPVAEYDPDAASLTSSQIAGIEEIAELYETSHPLKAAEAKPIRYDPFHTAQNTGPKKGGGASLSIPSLPDDPTA